MDLHPHSHTTYCFEEVSSVEWKRINMTEQEEDLLYRMHKLVGDRWELIAGRIPGRKAEEIERFWIMKHTKRLAKEKIINQATWHHWAELEADGDCSPVRLPALSK